LTKPSGNIGRGREDDGMRNNASVKIKPNENASYANASPFINLSQKFVLKI
jgi:hypothetical protein